MRCMTCACRVVVLLMALLSRGVAGTGPFEEGAFRGRVAYSADGNFNDPDDWAASPVALAIFAEAGLRDRVVHFDYNCIVPRNDPEWERIHAESVLGAAEQYGYDRALFHDCQQDLTAAISSITRAINASSADDPLYFILAGPMEVPYRGIEQSDPAKRKFVFCISHSRWNDGFSSAARHDFFTYNKRSVIEAGVNWVQIEGQNPLLRPNAYGREASDSEWGQYHWMRDSDDAKVRFLWERMQVSGHPDPSDAGMAYFLVCGDEQADPPKLRRLLDEKTVPAPISERPIVRLEAEDFPRLDGFRLEDRNDRAASHRLNVQPSGTGAARRIGTRFQQPFTATDARYQVDLRILLEPGAGGRLALIVNGQQQGEAVELSGAGEGWTTQTVSNVAIAAGDEIEVEVSGPARIDYVQLRR